MSARWYYAHDGRTRGPLSAQELRDHAARKLLAENDLVWQEGADAKDAVPAAAALDFSRPTAPASSIPDWLPDVASSGTTGPLPGPGPTHETPEWLEDLRLWVGLELYAARRQAEQDAHPARIGPLPDWLQGWLTLEKPPTQRPEPPPPGDRLPPPVISPPPDKPAPVTPPSAAPSPASPSQWSTQQPAPLGPLSAPAAPPEPPAPPQARAADRIAESIRQESGFDIETGAILDRQKFEKWKREQARSAADSQPGLTNLSLFEAFQKARSAIAAWVDDDKNRVCTMETDPEEIKCLPEIRQILAEYAGYGAEMRAKLLHYLEFVIENRRKYYAAIQAHGR